MQQQVAHGGSRRVQIFLCVGMCVFQKDHKRQHAALCSHTVAEVLCSFMCFEPVSVRADVYKEAIILIKEK